jgi:hypothetical protein
VRRDREPKARPTRAHAHAPRALVESVSHPGLEPTSSSVPRVSLWLAAAGQHQRETAVNQVKQRSERGARMARRCAVGMMVVVLVLLPSVVSADDLDESDTPGKAGGLMSGAASKAVGPSDGHRWHCGTVLRRQPGPGRAERHSLALPHRRPSQPPRRVPSRVHRCRRALRGGLRWGAPVVCPPQAPQEHSTPGTLKAVQVALVKPVAYLKD